MISNVLIIGSGGREHALAWKLAQSPRIGKLYVAPGNGGTGKVGENVPVSATDISKLAHFAEVNHIDLTVVGPDDPLALGVVDVFRSRGLRVFGPTRAAVQIEASKAFAKRLMRECHIPTSPSQTFRNYKAAVEYAQRKGAPIVIKASGLAHGKGAYPCQTLAEAERALKEIMLERAYGASGNEVVIEEFLYGEEVSIHSLCHGEDSLMLPPAQDHKSAKEGGVGEMTGGMGTIAPVPWVNSQMLSAVDELIVHPVLKALSAMGRPFTGCLYPGLMMTGEGWKVLEVNGRFGDPETQSYMRLVKTDLLGVLDACVDGIPVELKLQWNQGFAVCIVLASAGYPGKYKTGIPITGITEAEKIPGVVVFHAGTRFTDKLYTSSGRVCGVTATGETLKKALDLAYEAVNCIRFEGKQFRRDIGAKALNTGF